MSGSGGAPAPARIAVVEDDAAIRNYFLHILTGHGGFDVVGVAPDLAAAAALVALQPDLFLLDIGLPDGNGYDFIPVIKAQSRAKILVISAFGDRDTVIRTISAGADGYLLKDSAPETICEGIAVTLAGGAPISPAVARYLLESLRTDADQPAPLPAGGTSAPPSGPPSGPPSDDERLTPRENDLLRQFAQGASYKEAARALGISPLTVGNHVKAIYRKLEVSSRADAVRAAGLKSGTR